MNKRKFVFKLSIAPLLIWGLLLLFSTNIKAQDKSGKPVSTAETSKDLEKKKWERQRAVDKATKKALKAHMNHQTKDVRKRMKKDAKKAAKNNEEG